MNRSLSHLAWTRRSLLRGLAAVPLAGAVTACARQDRDEQGLSEQVTALVYRGPASCAGCSETLANRLSESPLDMDVAFIGPNEELPLEAGALAGADLYAQPGGGDDVLAAAEHFPSSFVRALGDFVAEGGSYLGVCMGAYLAGSDGFGFLDQSIEGVVDVPGFPVTDSSDQVVAITWEDAVRWTYFQEGARLPADGAETYAYYETGDIAAACYSYGLGVAGKDVVDVGAAVAVMGDSSAAQTALEVGGPQARPLISC